jgi:flagellar basal body P-ring formation protein FlgA
MAACIWYFIDLEAIMTGSALSHKTVLTMITNRLATLVLCLVFFAPCLAEQEFQPHDSIYELVKEAITRNITAHSEYEVSIFPLDSQLKLPKCTEPLEIFKATDLMKPGRTSIGVRCNAVKKWSIFVSAVIKTYEAVIVLSRPVQRGEIITIQHLAIEKRDVSNLRGDFITQIGQVENKQAAHTAQAGTILGSRSFVEPLLIKRGDKIIISSAQSAFAIRMSGIAMMDGTKGQVIRIKNESSGRIINAIVSEPGLVLVK